jgi:hypothetical protein
MTPKNQTKDGKSADKVAVEAQEIKAVLMEQPDFLQPVVQEAVQAILEMEMEECLQAGKHERTGERQGYRSGYYRRRLITRVGTLVLRVSQDRSGRFSTEVFEQYQRSEKALVAALAQMYVQGVFDAQGGGGDAGVVRARVQRFEHQRDHQPAGRAADTVQPASFGGGVSVCDCGRALRAGARGRSDSEPGGFDRAGDRLGRPAAGVGGGICATREPEQLEGSPFRIEEAWADRGAPGC